LNNASACWLTQLLPVVAQDLRQTGRLFADIGHHCWLHSSLPLKLAAIETFARQHPVRRILLLATGSSLNAALCARYFFARQAGSSLI
jgi:hypothetical protein